jgi:hypothetical protein
MSKLFSKLESKIKHGVARAEEGVDHARAMAIGALPPGVSVCSAPSHAYAS